jgi:hypothetical protein
LHIANSGFTATDVLQAIRRRRNRTDNDRTNFQGRAQYGIDVLWMVLWCGMLHGHEVFAGRLGGIKDEVVGNLYVCSVLELIVYNR